MFARTSSLVLFAFAAACGDSGADPSTGSSTGDGSSSTGSTSFCEAGLPLLSS